MAGRRGGGPRLDILPVHHRQPLHRRGRISVASPGPPSRTATTALAGYPSEAGGADHDGLDADGLRHLRCVLRLHHDVLEDEADASVAEEAGDLADKVDGFQEEAASLPFVTGRRPNPGEVLARRCGREDRPCRAAAATAPGCSSVTSPRRCSQGSPALASFRQASWVSQAMASIGCPNMFSMRAGAAPMPSKRERTMIFLCRRRQPMAGRTVIGAPWLSNPTRTGPRAVPAPAPGVISATVVWAVTSLASVLLVPRRLPVSSPLSPALVLAVVLLKIVGETQSRRAATAYASARRLSLRTRMCYATMLESSVYARLKDALKHPLGPMLGRGGSWRFSPRSPPSCQGFWVCGWARLQGSDA